MSNLCETPMCLAVVHNDPNFGRIYPCLEDFQGIVNNNKKKKWNILNCLLSIWILTVSPCNAFWTLCFRPGWVFKWDTQVQQQCRVSQHNGLVSLHVQGWIHWRWILLLRSHTHTNLQPSTSLTTFLWMNSVWLCLCCDHLCRHRWVRRQQQPVWEWPLPEHAGGLPLWMWHGLHCYDWRQGLRG